MTRTLKSWDGQREQCLLHWEVYGKIVPSEDGVCRVCNERMDENERREIRLYLVNAIAQKWTAWELPFAECAAADKFAFPGAVIVVIAASPDTSREATRDKLRCKIEAAFGCKPKTLTVKSWRTSREYLTLRLNE